METHSISLMIIAVCILMSAYFSATETAFSSLNRIRVKNMAEKGNRRAALVLKLSEDYDGLLSTILIGNNIVNIACASLATILFVKMLGEEAGASVSTVVTTIVVLIFGEVSPKSIAKESPEKFAMFSAPILHLFLRIFTPANFLFRQWKRLLSKIFKTSEDQGITEEELLTIVEEARQDGGIDEQESTMIRSAIEFTDLEAQDILTPRIDLTGISADEKQERIAEIFAETGFSRLPVYDGTIDHIIGILYQKDFYNKIYHTDRDVKSIIRPALYITKNKTLKPLLAELQQRKMHIAVVLDEFGGTSGIVTMEDILEELVGEIWDEHDKVEEELEKVSELEYRVAGTLSVDKLPAVFQEKEESEFLTVNGWIMDLFGRVPKAGESLVNGDVEIRIEEMKGKRIKWARLRKTEEAAA